MLWALKLSQCIHNTVHPFFTKNTQFRRSGQVNFQYISYRPIINHEQLEPSPSQASALQTLVIE